MRLKKYLHVINEAVSTSPAVNLCLGYFYGALLGLIMFIAENAMTKNQLDRMPLIFYIMLIPFALVTYTHAVIVVRRMIKEKKTDDTV